MLLVFPGSDNPISLYNVYLNVLNLDFTKDLLMKRLIIRLFSLDSKTVLP